ncbi:MAG: hypothetical protein P8Y30_08685 [candidate division WOR-3 bacterium]
MHPTKKEVKFHNDRYVMSTIKRTLNETVGVDSDYRRELFSFKKDFLFEGDTKSKFWQLHDSYIVAQTNTGLVIIDQHAAHERILYDNLKNNENFNTQSLLFPIQVNHTPLEILKLEELKEVLKDLGFVFRVFSGNVVVWEGIPSLLTEINEDQIRGILEDLSKEKETTIDNLLKSVSCHLAIKAGDPLSIEEMENLVNLLFSTDKPFRCPHGRPVLFEISLKDIENKLLR